MVIAYFSSLNVPHIGVPGLGAGPTKAHILGVQMDQGGRSVCIYLQREDEESGCGYVPGGGAAGRYEELEAAAVEFAESMGFLLDHHKLEGMSAPERTAWVSALPIYTPPPPASKEAPSHAPPSENTASTSSASADLSASQVVESSFAQDTQPPSSARGAVEAEELARLLATY